MQCSLLILRRSPLLAAFSLLAIQGCQAVNLTSQPIFDTQQTARDANRALQILNPAGTRLDDAILHMEQAGFQCQPLATAAAGYQKSVLCTISTPNVSSTVAPPPTPVLWTVSLDSRDGQTLGTLHASRTPKGL